MFETPGGGGWGDPTSRTESMIRADVESGLVSQEQLSQVYVASED